MDKNKIKLIAMDLDGTLSQHKQFLPDRNKKALKILDEKYLLVMMGAGQVMRVFNQMEQFPIDIVGNYGLQFGRYNHKSKNIDIERDLSFPVDKVKIEEKV